MANLKITLPELDLGTVDTIITVRGTTTALGRIKLSKGTIEWWTAGSHVNGKTLTWKEFAQFFEKYGNDKIVSAKPSAKKAPPATKASKAGSAKKTV